VRAFNSPSFAWQLQDVRSHSWETDSRSCNKQVGPSTCRDLRGTVNYNASPYLSSSYSSKCNESQRCQSFLCITNKHISLKFTMQDAFVNVMLHALILALSLFCGVLNQMASEGIKINLRYIFHAGATVTGNVVEVPIWLYVNLLTYHHAQHLCETSRCA